MYIHRYAQYVEKVMVVHTLVLWEYTSALGIETLLLQIIVKSMLNHCLFA